jgi:cytochrome c-type biogenesis protein
MDLLDDIWTSFVLGLITPLTALCVVPLYPAFLARLAQRVSGRGGDRRLLLRFGLVVSAGVIVFMTLLGLVFTTILQRSLTQVIGVVSPIAFGILFVLGLLLIVGVRLERKVRAPRFDSPSLSAFSYGFFFGAIVVPCNPLIIAAFFTRTATVTGFAENLLSFFAFALGISAPLVAFSLMSRTVARGVVAGLVRFRRVIEVAAGLTMVVVSAYYLAYVFHVVPLLS